eukprot:c45689_g1_i1 orf=87-260(+)
MKYKRNLLDSLSFIDKARIVELVKGVKAKVRAKHSFSLDQQEGISKSSFCNNAKWRT